MSAMIDGEQRPVVRFECWSCEFEWFVSVDDRGEVEQCPSCGATEGLGVQGRSLEVRA